MNRKVTKRAVAGVAIAMTLVSNTAVGFAAGEATQKEENVYATLNGDGTVSGIYVVNSYDLTGDTTIFDYGTYTSVKNLTTDEEIKVADEQVTITAEQGKFFYQGNLESKDMPWDIAISYELDGQEISASDLGGKSGNLIIRISIKQNKAVDASFFENYTMQVSLSLDTAICQNINADGATVANIGSSKQLLYNILPGNEKEIVISADVTDFTMDQISFKGVDSSIDISADSIDTSEISDETGKITDAAEKLDSAAQSLLDGTSTLGNGADKINDALSQLDGKSSSLTSASASVLKALQQIDEELKKVSFSTSDLSKLVTASATINSSLSAASTGMASLDSALSYTTMNSSIWNALGKQSGGKVTESNKEQLAAALTSDTITTQLAALPDGELKSGILAYVSAAQNYVAIDEAYQKGLSQYMSTVKGSVNEKSGSAYLASSLEELSSKYDEFDATIKTLESSLSGLAGKMDTLKSSIDTLVTEYSKLDSGITAYADGVSEILSGYSSLVSGISSLEDGTKELKEGTSQFKDETSGIDDMVDEKIDSMIDSFTNSDFETVSFVSEKNTNVDAVQFAMVTESIKEPEAEKPIIQEESKSFLQKLKDLF